MNRRRVALVVAAAAAAGAALSCRDALRPPSAPETLPFESEGWRLRLRYPADWSATPGEGVAPLVVELRAPGRRDTIGAGVSVVAAWSAAPLSEVAAQLERGLEPLSKATAAATTVGGCPARALEYRARRGEDWVRTRVVVVRGDERIYILTFASYEPQYETVRPYFAAIEKSVAFY